jgi:hypothetical protein
MTDGRFLEQVKANPRNAAILARLTGLGLNDAWLVSGALFQTVWNSQCGFAPDHGIKDYDIFYFDPDTSWEAENAVIAKTRAAFADLGVAIELRNQARVHLWYEKKFALPYPPLACATHGIDRFLCRNAMVGVNADGALYAPHGFSDIEAMIVRPNRAPNFSEKHFLEKARNWQSLWPGISIAEN